MLLIGCWNFNRQSGNLDHQLLLWSFHTITDSLGSKLKLAFSRKIQLRDVIVLLNSLAQMFRGNSIKICAFGELNHTHSTAKHCSVGQTHTAFPFSFISGTYHSWPRFLYKEGITM